MLDDFFTQPEAERFLLNRRAAIVLGTCAILSLALVAFHCGLLNPPSPTNHLAAEWVDWSIVPLCLSALVLLSGSSLFVFRCGTQPARDKLLWGLMLLFAFPYAEIAVYCFLYIPALRARLSGSNQIVIKLDGRG